MSKCWPVTALATQPQKYHWQFLGYETEQIEEVMVSAGPETKAPDIRLPLERQG